MKKTILFLLFLIVLSSIVYSATPILLDSFEGDSLDSSGVYYCGSYSPSAQPFNCSTALNTGNTLEIEIYTTDITRELEADDLINVTIVAANTSGEPIGEPTIYAQNVTGGTWWNDLTGWQGQNLTFTLDSNMPIGWYVMIFKCETCDDDTTERIGISVDTSSDYYGLPSYSFLELNPGCDIWTGTSTQYSTRTYTGFRVWGTTEAVDSTNPTATIEINNTSPKINEDVNISSNVTDGVGVSQCWFNNNFTNTNSTTIDLAGTTDSCNNITTISASSGETINFTVYVNDTSNNIHSNSTTLTVTSETPTFNETLTNQSISSDSLFEYNINCSDIEEDTITYFDNSTLFDIISTNGSIYDVPIESEVGLYHINIACGDGLSNTTSEFWYNITDGTEPTYTNFKNNASNSGINSIINWSIDLSDGIGLSVVKFAHNQSGTLTNVTNLDISGTSFSANYTLPITLAQGNVICGQFWFNDSTDNINNSNLSCMTVDNTAPTISLTSPDDNDHNKVNLTIDYTPNDADSDGLDCYLFINNSLNTTDTTINLGVSNTITSINLNVEGDYSWYINCSDETVNTTTIARTYTLDLTNPILTIHSPLNETSHSIDFIINFTASDDNLYIINYTLFNATQVFQSNQTNTAVATILNITDNVDISALSMSVGTYYINFSASDQHTINSISDYNVKKGTDYLLYDNKIKISAKDAISVDTTKSKDRYSFEFNYEKINPPTTKIFTLESNSDLYYISTSKYKAHFIDWANRKWIDFEGINGKPIIKKISDKKYTITFENANDNVVFNSIGGLNVVEKQYTIYIVDKITLDYLPTNLSLNYTEGTNLTFSVTATDTNASETHIIQWFLDGVRQAISYVAQGTANVWHWFIGYIGAEVNNPHNVTVYVNDSDGNMVSQIWIINATNTSVLESFEQLPTYLSFNNETITLYCQVNNSNVEVNMSYRLPANDIWRNASMAVYNSSIGSWISTVITSIKYTWLGTLDFRCSAKDTITNITSYQYDYDTVEVYATDVAPDTPNLLTPSDGIFDSVIKINCFAIDANNDTVYYDIQANYTNLSNEVTDWVNLTTNASSGKYEWFVLNLPEQNYTDIRCRASDGQYSAWYNPDSSIKIRHNYALQMFSYHKPETFLIDTNLIFNVYCSTDGLNNSDIYESYSDCNNDGQWDYVFKHHNLTNTTDVIVSSHNYFTCVYDEEGTKDITVGCVIKKSNTNLTWDKQICKKLSTNDIYCNFRKTYEVIVYEDPP